jgi:Dual specificity phosphatase, catalytic domain
METSAPDATSFQPLAARVALTALLIRSTSSWSHCSGCGRRAGAKPHRGESPSRTPKCSRQRKDPRSPPKERRSRRNQATAVLRFVMASSGCSTRSESRNRLLVCFVNKRLAFGSGITSWRHVEQLQALGITHVINLRFNRHGKKEKSFKVLWIPFRDDKQPRPQWFYRKTWKFYSKAMKQPNSKMFIMCRVGICRSASLAYFLLRGSGMNCEEAHDVVVRTRRAASICKAYGAAGESWLSAHRSGCDIR